MKRLSPFLVSLAIVLFDRWTKIGIDHSMTSLDSVTIVPGWLRIIHTENAGAAFGILAEGNPWLRSAILIGVSGAVLLFVVSALWNAQGSFSGLWARLSLALILGGALGNLYDRVLRGTVTDFIEVYHGAWSFPAFNVADSAITVGAVVLFFELLRQPRNKAVKSEPGLAHK